MDALAPAAAQLVVTFSFPVYVYACVYVLLPPPPPYQLSFPPPSARRSPPAPLASCHIFLPVRVLPPPRLVHLRDDLSSTSPIAAGIGPPAVRLIFAIAARTRISKVDRFRTSLPSGGGVQARSVIPCLSYMPLMSILRLPVFFSL